MTQAVLHDKVVFITGAGSGIGRAAAHLFAEHGARVAAIDLDAESGQASVQEIRERGRQAVFIQADVTQGVDVAHAVEQAVAHFGRIEAGKTVAAGVIDVKNYFIETPEIVADRIRRVLAHVPPDRLVVAPDCGLSQTARWAARAKLQAMVEGAKIVRGELG